MIIFDLDGTLALIDHRRYFVDPQEDHPDYFRNPCESCKDGSHHKIDPQIHKVNGKPWKPDWDAFFEACDKDEPNKPICEVFLAMNYEPYKREIEIWSGRSESVREKTVKWIEDNIPEFERSTYINRILKMRPLGDYTPDDQLKEKWLDEVIAQGKTVQMVFDDRQKVVDMWRRRGITCLQVAQGDF